MVRIFADNKGSGEYVIQTTALETEVFVFELAEAMDAAMKNSADGAQTAVGIMKNAMPIAFKLSGYKADGVAEQRTLVCGIVSPENCEVVSTAGR